LHLAEEKKQKNRKEKRMRPEPCGNFTIFLGKESLKAQEAIKNSAEAREDEFLR